MATTNAAKTAKKNKTRYDRRVTASDLNVGDRVLIRNVRLRGKHKISDKWEATVHVVVGRAGTLPVYTVKPENKESLLRTLHRDLLLPCGYLPTEDKHFVPQPSKCRPSTRANPSADESVLSDEEEVEIIPIYWFRDPARVQGPTLGDIAQANPGVFPNQDPQCSILPLDHLVESLPSFQHVDSLPEVDRHPVRPGCTADDPPTCVQPDSHPCDTEHLPTDVVIMVDSNGSTEDVLPDTQRREPPMTLKRQQIHTDLMHKKINRLAASDVQLGREISRTGFSMQS